MSESRRGDWIQVHSGRAFWPLDPREDELFIEDVAQGLSHLCRFGGQCREFYSVAQHSVLVSELCEGFTPTGADSERRSLNALSGLLHDAPEAFIADLPRPVRSQLPSYNDIEAGLWQVCAQRWGLLDADGAKFLYDEEILRRADDTALVTEKRDLMAVSMHWGLEEEVEPVPRTILPVPSSEARGHFLERFKVLQQRLGRG